MSYKIKKLTKEHKRNISLALKGIKRSEETRNKMSRSKKGKKMPPVSKETREKMSNARKGDKHYNWKGGITTYPRKLFLNLRRKARKMNAEGSHTQKEWEDLKKKYNYMCLCCKKQEPEIKLTQDHIIPLDKGGSDYIWNIQPLCKNCNSKKHTKIIKYDQ